MMRKQQAKYACNPRILFAEQFACSPLESDTTDLLFFILDPDLQQNRIWSRRRETNPQ
jgi:hypothetical protein